MNSKLFSQCFREVLRKGYFSAQYLGVLQDEQPCVPCYTGVPERWELLPAVPTPSAITQDLCHQEYKTVQNPLPL